MTPPTCSAATRLRACWTARREAGCRTSPVPCSWGCSPPVSFVQASRLLHSTPLPPHRPILRRAYPCSPTYRFVAAIVPAAGCAAGSVPAAACKFIFRCDPPQPSSAICELDAVMRVLLLLSQPGLASTLCYRAPLLSLYSLRYVCNSLLLEHTYTHILKERRCSKYGKRRMTACQKVGSRNATLIRLERI